MDLLRSHDDIHELQRRHSAWQLLRARTAPLALAFLGGVFVEENLRSVSRTDLVTRLEELLHALNSRMDDGDQYARSAAQYVDEWAEPGTGWLRAYYPPGADEPAYDATPAVEKALTWLRSLQPTDFVGTESRLNTVIELLRQIAFGAEMDPQVRLEELHRRRKEIQEEIDRVSAGRVDLLDPAAQRDRYQQFASTARELLADFRQVEENFRSLDRTLREKVATWSGGKGELLEEVLGDRRGIADSDQGRSFHAFYDFLLSAPRQEEFTELLARVQRLPDVARTLPDTRLRHIHHDWLDAAERTQATVRQLSDQLRRFVDDQVRLENRRVMEILRGIEAAALAARGISGQPPGMEVEATEVDVVLPTERPLYRRRRRLELDSDGIADATERADTTALYEQVYLDPARLAAAVADGLARRPVAALPDILREHPLQQGLAELVGYLALRDGVETTVDDDRRDEVGWTGDDDVDRVAVLPHVVYSRAGAPRATTHGEDLR